MKFLTEFFARFGLETPSFFTILSRIGLIAGFLTGIPLLLTTFQGDLGVILPDWVHVFSQKMALGGAIAIWIIAKLPVKPGQINTESDKQTKLPFTAKRDTKIPMILLILCSSLMFMACSTTRIIPTPDVSQKDFVKDMKISTAAFYDNMIESKNLNFAPYSVGYTEHAVLIDSLLARDKRRSKAGSLVKQDILIKDAWNLRMTRHYTYGSLTEAQANADKTYMLSYWQARLVAELQITPEPNAPAPIK